SDDGLAANGVATASPIDEQVALTFDDNGIRVSPENPADYAGETVGSSLLFGVGHGLGAGGSKLREHLSGGVLAIADAGHQVVRTAQTIIAGDALQVGIFDVFE